MNQKTGQKMNPQKKQDLIVDFTLAVWGGSKEQAAALLDKYPDIIHWRDKDGGTPLRKSVAHGTPDMEIVKLIVVRGADVNARDDLGMTPLMFAAMHGAREALDYLLERGAGTAMTDRQGQTAADFAQKNGHPDIAAVLQKHEKRVQEAAEAARHDALEKDAATAHDGIDHAITVRKPVALVR